MPSSFLNDFFRDWPVTRFLKLAYLPFFTEYRGSPALLSEKIEESEEISAIYKSPLFVYLHVLNFAKRSNFPLKNGFWILGSSYNYSLINAINDTEYGKQSFYEQSLKTGKICKRGTSCFSKIWYMWFKKYIYIIH